MVKFKFKFKLPKWVNCAEEIRSWYCEMDKIVYIVKFEDEDDLLFSLEHEVLHAVIDELEGSPTWQKLDFIPEKMFGKRGKKHD